MTNNVIGLQKVSLRELHPSISNALLVGIIIGKQRPRIFASKKNTQNETRAVWNFTLRDSIRDYVNVTCWGGNVPINHLSDESHIGDVVEIFKPRIEIRKVNDYGEQFRPMVTSPYTLSIYEPMEQVMKHDGDCTPYKRLLSYPTKPLAGFVTLGNIMNSANSSNTNSSNKNSSNPNSSSYIKPENVDLLVAVKSIGESRTINSKTGEQLPVRDIMVFDHTNPGMRITIWEPEIISLANNWKSRSTILFMTDMRIEYNNFFKTKTAGLSQRTIITEDPIGPEAETLRQYALEAPLQLGAILDSMTCAIPDVNTIQNVMTINQVTSKIAAKLGGVQGDPQFTGLLYVMITHFNLDRPQGIVSTKCARCRSILDPQDQRCVKEYCPVAMDMEHLPPERSLDIRLELSDHTGVLTGCRLSGTTAEGVLRCNVQDFLLKSEEEVTCMKWRYLMERCAVRVLVLCNAGRAPAVSVLSMELVDAGEVARKLPHF